MNLLSSGGVIRMGETALQGLNDGGRERGVGRDRMCSGDVKSGVW